MILEYLINKALTSSILFIFVYTCTAILLLSLACIIEEEVQRIKDRKRQDNELPKRPERSIDAFVDEIYES